MEPSFTEISLDMIPVKITLVRWSQSLEYLLAC